MKGLHPFSAIRKCIYTFIFLTADLLIIMDIHIEIISLICFIIITVLALAIVVSIIVSNS